MKYAEVKPLAIYHQCLTCGMKYCKSTHDANCAFCKSSALFTIETKDGI